jgi:mitochondrial fission protein ELM1
MCSSAVTRSAEVLGDRRFDDPPLPSAHAGVSASRDAPATWVLFGAREGDNAQVEALACALGWPFREVRLDFNALFHLPNPLLGASLASLTPESRRQLRPPWPRLVIAVGRRTVAPARWIRQASGGRAKLVHIGRPRAPLDLFDLIITTPQYGLPERPNVLKLALPMHLPAQVSDQYLHEWRTRFEALPRPWTGVLIGGSVWPYVCGRAAAMRLARALNRFVARSFGSALIVTSRRTGAGIAPLLRSKLVVPCGLWEWRPEHPNPYAALLALADRFVVTADSASMVAQAGLSGRPVALFELDLRDDPLSRAGRFLGRQAGEPNAIGGVLGHLTARAGVSPPRCMAHLHDAMFASEGLRRFDPEREIESSDLRLLQARNMRVAVERVCALLDRSAPAFA